VARASARICVIEINGDGADAPAIKQETAKTIGKEEVMPGFIEREQWKTFLDEFSKRNQMRATRLEVVGDIGDQEEEKYVPLIGVSPETKGSEAGSVEIILGGQTAADPRHVEHRISHVERIAPLVGPTGLEQGLGIEDKDGVKTLLLFETLPEIPEKTSDEQEAGTRPAA